MRLALLLRQEAEADLEDAALWYEEQSLGLGSRFLDQVLETFAAISQTPRQYPLVHRGVRRALIRHFPFGVYFLIETDAIIVLAVMHGSRNPGKWKGRS